MDVHEDVDLDDPITHESKQPESQKGHYPFENDNPRQLSLIVDSDKNKRAVRSDIIERRPF